MKYSIRWENKNFDDMGTLTKRTVSALYQQSSVKFRNARDVQSDLRPSSINIWSHMISHVPDVCELASAETNR